jgi:hypothetical protein
MFMAPALPRLPAAALAVPLALFAGCARDVSPPGGQRVEEVASLSERPGNPAVTADGRLIFTMHPLIADAMRADPTRDDPPAIIAVDLRSGRARRVLDGHPSFEPAPLPAFTLRSGLLRAAGADGQKRTIRFGLDPITIDTEHEWVVWGPGNAQSLYRARAADLADPALPAEELARRVERYRDKANSDGISMDRLGNVYVTDLLRGAVGVSTAEGYRVLARDPRMIWPDGLAFGPDGLLYVSVSQVGRMPFVNDGQDRGQPPYVVLRLRPLAPSEVGR